MIDWLYGELNETTAYEVSGHVGSCARCQAEQAAFARTRDLFRQLPEQEPAPSLTDMLVREAALSVAPKAAVALDQPAGGGFGEWLARFFRPLMHPAAAALATLVLVAGVAGSLYLNQSGDPEKYEDSRAAKGSEKGDSLARKESDENEIETPAAATPPALSEALDDANLDGKDRAALEGGLVTNRTVDLLDAERASELRANRDTAQPARRLAPKELAATKIDGVESPKQNLNKGLKNKKTTPRERERQLAKTIEKPAASPAPRADRSDADDEEFASEDSGLRGASSAAFRGQRLGSDSWAQGLESELATAYKRDDCLAAARIANDIRERNPNYYKRNTSDLTAVKKCRYYVNSERKRRSAQARKAAKKTGTGSANSTDASKKAAPADEQHGAVEVE